MHILVRKYLKHGKYNETIQIFEEIGRDQPGMHWNENPMVSTELQRIVIIHI